MSKHTFSKMIISAFLTICMTVTIAGCSSPTESPVSSVTSDVNSTESSVQSSAESSIQSSAESYVESSFESSVESSADNTTESESNIDESTSQPEETEIETPEQISQPPESVVWKFEPASDIDNPESQTDDPVTQQSFPSQQNNTDGEKHDGNIVVMLDPGHDDDCSPRNQPALGVNEQDLNLKIGLACYERLSQYEGVTPYLTRYDGSCPNADKQFDDGGNYDCVQKRAFLANEKNADIFVSLHCNAMDSTLGTSANGICVFITNYAKYTEACRQLGELIINHVTNDVDLDSMGVRQDYTLESKGYYDDGSVKDHYYLLSYNIDYGRPSIIIEHAFMDNIHDNEILKDDEQLKLIGYADADAIAEYYGLKLK